jgi:hypothetical protein
VNDLTAEDRGIDGAVGGGEATLPRAEKDED